jgi:hypothetical protein
MLDRLVHLTEATTQREAVRKMQEKKDQPGQGDVGSPQKPLPGDEVGKQGGDIGKKGGSGDVGSEKPSQPGTEKKL